MNKKRLCELKRSKEYIRLGKLFYTSQSTYLYDTGTGKVVKLDPEGKKLMEALFDEQISVEAFEGILDSLHELETMCSFLEREHLLCNPPVTEFVQLNQRTFEEDFRCGQLIIELTGNCNLRCKYCIYNDFYEGNRNFNTSNITFETARKAIDYVHIHRDPEHFAVTFYGGEPLLNFPVMKQCIDYCLDKFKDEGISFSFTTNLTLMTEEIAEYVAQVPNMSILVSIDGPEEIHNMARVKRKGEGSFQDAFNGLKILSAAINKYKMTSLMFSSVLMPPYTTKRFDAINDFFKSLDFLPENTEVRATYPSTGTVSQSYIDDLRAAGIGSISEISWMDWSKEAGRSDDFSGVKRNLYTGILESALVRIQNRVLHEHPMARFHRGGCCIPGQRRLYVCTDGSYRVCERVGTAPAIGHVDAGIDVKSITKNYIEGYDEKSLPDCSNCWAINLCDICYAKCYDEFGINVTEKRKECLSTRAKMVLWLQYYHELLETRPERIEEISKIELS